MARVLNYQGDYRTHLPVSGGGTALVDGALLKGPATPATDNGHLQIVASGTSTNPDIYGILRGSHAVATDVDVAGTVFATNPVDIIVPTRVVRLDFSQASGDLITCTQAVTTTAMTVTSEEDDIDASFFYVVSGTGAGQTNYLTAAAAGSCTLKAAFATSLDTTSKFIKIIARFNRLIGLTADGTKLKSTAAAGGTSAVVLDIWMERNGNAVQLDPTKHSALVGLNAGGVTKFYADVLLRDTIPYSID